MYLLVIIMYGYLLVIASGRRPTANLLDLCLSGPETGERKRVTQKANGKLTES